MEVGAAAEFGRDDGIEIVVRHGERAQIAEIAQGGRNLAGELIVTQVAAWQSSTVHVKRHAV